MRGSLTWVVNKKATLVLSQLIQFSSERNKETWWSRNMFTLKCKGFFQICCQIEGVDIHLRMRRLVNIGYGILNKRFSPDFKDRIILYITHRIKNTPVVEGSGSFFTTLIFFFFLQKSIFWQLDSWFKQVRVALPLIPLSPSSLCSTRRDRHGSGREIGWRTGARARKAGGRAKGHWSVKWVWVAEQELITRCVFAQHSLRLSAFPIRR